MPPVCGARLRVQPQRDDSDRGHARAGVFWISTISRRILRLPWRERARPRARRLPVRPRTRGIAGGRMLTAPGMPNAARPPARSRVRPPCGRGIIVLSPARSSLAPGSRSRCGRARGSTLRRTNDAGINRVAWDLTGEPPVPWRRRGAWNRGRAAAAAAGAPGALRARLHAAPRPSMRHVTDLHRPACQMDTQRLLARYAFRRKTLDDELLADRYRAEPPRRRYARTRRRGCAGLSIPSIESLPQVFATRKTINGRPTGCASESRSCRASWPSRKALRFRPTCAKQRSTRRLRACHGCLRRISEGEPMIPIHRIAAGLLGVALFAFALPCGPERRAGSPAP